MAHNAAWSDYAAGFRETVFVCAESTYGTITHPNQNGDDAISILTCSFEHKQERVNRADKTSTRSYNERISHRKDTTWSINAYLIPYGTAVTAPDIDPALVAAFGRKASLATASAAIASSSTTTSINITNGSVPGTWEVGGAVHWINAAGEAEVSFIVSITTTGDPDVVVVSPPFSAAPSAGQTLYGSVSYFLSDSLTSLCFTRVLDNIVDVWPGCFVNDVAFDFPGTGEGTITLGGSGKTSYLGGVSYLSGSATNVATTLVIPAGHAKRFDANIRVQVEDEVVLVSAVTEDATSLGNLSTATATPTAGGSMVATTHYFRAACLDGKGRVGTANTEFTGTTAGGNLSLTIAFTAITGAAGYRIYHGTGTGSYNGYKDVPAMNTPSYVILNESEFTSRTAGGADANQTPKYDTLTVTRAQAGTSGVAHNIAVQMGPYQPTRVIHGSPVSSCLGDFIIVLAGLTRAQCTLKTQQVNLTLNNQGTLRNVQYGTCESIGFKVLRRDVAFSASLWLEPAQAASFNKARAFVSQEVVHQHGKTTGNIIAWRMPLAEFNIPKIDGGGDDDVVVPFSGSGFASVTGNDELVVAFV